MPVLRIDNSVRFFDSLVRSFDRSVRYSDSDVRCSDSAVRWVESSVLKCEYATDALSAPGTRPLSESAARAFQAGAPDAPAHRR